MAATTTTRPTFEQGHARGHGDTPDRALEVLEHFATGSILDELGGQGRYVLDRLIKLAPGTLIHSVRVARIVQQIIDSDRIAAAILLHDCGKLVAPEAFAENQEHGSPRPHGSTIYAHVSAGMLIARNARLSDHTIQAIAEHHGTLPAGSCLRYPGPIPSAPWTQLLMIADCFEALDAQGRLTDEKAAALMGMRIDDRQLPASVVEQYAPQLLSICRELS